MESSWEKCRPIGRKAIGMNAKRLHRAYYTDELGWLQLVLSPELSDQEHYQHEEHNAQYDHEAFLGEDAKTFDQLTPEESRRRLGLIVDKIDKDEDGFVNQEELKDWIQFTQKRYIVDDVERQWKTHNPENKEKITWDEYKKMVYGFMDGQYHGFSLFD
uniref:Reticulocalbin-3 n=1 Tax=Timema californicum TaxID=61474 RepID=A0A7R9J6T9_TIMCA|nr:unnamed protein product [Timema californicum]